MSQPLFGLIPAGQPVIISPTEAPSPTSFLYAIPPTNPNSPPGSAISKPFGHVVVFLLPGVVLPPGTAAAIYLVTPPSPALGQTAPNFKFLGGIGPGKESAIFKVGPGAGGTGGGNENVVIGVSVEDAESVASRMTATGTTTPAAAPTSGNGTEGALVPVSAARQQPSTLVLAQRIIKNAFNFLSSYTGSTPGQMEVVPLKAFEEWWKKFESKVRTDPGFLERDDDQ
ncbi:hypothetical protein NEUTE1DRAFT_145523 [Neurospora tetrasperma FGSC 2508]|uniref:Hikeshi-like domain-containing protein n=2 Tax=Neurospora TaxID=5140 RepID=A0AAJ0MNV9_9PEZI|nr:uncharacterized protein NEUTE1DRAFT_145523 [Neurospora tetrasperma FGSC 2508]EGO59531.1 hypothetical protein NEUTE1DRAFT_145523 [Neurospora tetrasperma FGSC 2508]EGZ73662.1 hypothetical protein NEUTE2DRAFT_108476 [Neurospora tetrasperma FGSC 2509]KAK3488192.1 hypothetical protein B0T23DRAFT_323431 [Neurospora hispaniola]